MLELMLCSLLTIVPDYLYRRFVQGKRWGREITLFSVWYELRWGITACLMLTLLLITVIFYFHPSTSSATPLFRAVPILPETNGRVSEIFVNLSGDVKAGAWHELRAQARGDRFAIYWDGKNVLESPDATFASPGRVGLWTKADSVTLFDDLVVTAP